MNNINFQIWIESIWKNGKAYYCDGRNKNGKQNGVEEIELEGGREGGRERARERLWKFKKERRREGERGKVFNVFTVKWNGNKRNATSGMEDKRDDYA